MTQLVVLGPILKPLTAPKGLQKGNVRISFPRIMLESFAMCEWGLPVCDHGSHKISVLISEFVCLGPQKIMNSCGQEFG